MCLYIYVYMCIYIYTHHSPRRNIFPEIVCVRWKRCAISTIYCSVKWLEIVLYSKINESHEISVGNNFGIPSRENDFDKTKKNTRGYLESWRALAKQRSVPTIEIIQKKAESFTRHLHGNTPVVNVALLKRR